jgi:hypothetical protein
LSLRAISGVVGLNLWLLAVGNALLFALRGWRSWSQVGRLLGLGYMLGVAGLGTVWVWQLTLGIDLTIASILLAGFLLAAVATVVGVSLGRPRPARSLVRFRPPRTTFVSAVFGGLTLVYLEALFRGGRLAGLYEFDAWFFWVPKAKAIYTFGDLDLQFFRDLPNPAYPPLLPALEAAAFHFMGSMDVVTLHLQFWFLLVGFVAAVAGVLAGRVPPLLIWVPLLLVLVTPNVVATALYPQADVLLDELFALAALLTALWLIDRAQWMVAATVPLLGAAMLTKREGFMFAACLTTAALLVTAREARATWTKLTAVALGAVAVTVPWWVFLDVQNLGSRGSETGGRDALAHFERAWPSLRLALSTLFDFGIWLFVVPLLVLAIAAALASGARRLPIYAAFLSLLCVAGLTWSTWAFPSFPFTKDPALNPIVRVSGGLVLAGAVLVPLLLLQTRESRAERR